MRVSTGGAASAAVSTKQASEHGSAHPLDNPVLASLTGPHARFAQRRGGAVRYPADVSPFLAIPDEPTEQDWADIAVLAASGAVVAVTGTAILLPASWQAVATGEGVQMTGNDVTPAPDEEAVRLTRGDVPDMLALVKRTRPGPFLPRTIELGAYLGIRRDGKLVSRWRARACTRPAGRRSARSAPTPPIAARALPVGWSAPWPMASSTGTRRRSCTRPRATPTRSASMSPWASGCVGPWSSRPRKCLAPRRHEPEPTLRRWLELSEAPPADFGTAMISAFQKSMSFATLSSASLPETDRRAVRTAHFAAASRGELRTVVDRVPPLRQAVLAHQKMDAGEAVGRIVLAP
jgi:hypothetical protein